VGFEADRGCNIREIDFQGQFVVGCSWLIGSAQLSTRPDTGIVTFSITGTADGVSSTMLDLTDTDIVMLSIPRTADGVSFHDGRLEALIPDDDVPSRADLEKLRRGATV
jgi:hypothetical protein